MISDDILDRLRVDPGKRTLGELLQDREAAAQEIRRLRAEIERLRNVRMPRKGNTEAAQPEEKRNGAFRPGSLIRISEVCELIGVSRTTIYRWMTEGEFPQPVRLSKYAVRWRIDDVESWRDTLGH